MKNIDKKNTMNKKYPKRIKYKQYGDALRSINLYSIPNSISAIRVIISLKCLTFTLINEINNQVILVGGHGTKSKQTIRRKAKKALVNMGVQFETEERKEGK